MGPYRDSGGCRQRNDNVRQLPFVVAPSIGGPSKLREQRQLVCLSPVQRKRDQYHSRELDASLLSFHWFTGLIGRHEATTHLRLCLLLLNRTAGDVRLDT